MKSKKLLIAISIGVVGLILLAFFVAQISFSKQQKEIERLVGLAVEFSDNQLSKTSFFQLDADNSKISELAEQTDILLSRLKGQYLIRFFLSGKLKDFENEIVIKKETTQLIASNVSKALDYLRKPNEIHVNTINSAQSTIHSIKSEIGNNSSSNDLINFRERIMSSINISQVFMNEIENELSKKVLADQSELIRRNVSNKFHLTHQDLISKFSTAEKLLSDAIRYQDDQRKNLNGMSRLLISQSEGLSVIYRNILPVSREVQSKVQPIRENIRTLEQPLVSMGPLGRSVTPLSIISSVDPATGHAITSVRDLTDMILGITNEVDNIVGVIEPLRQAALGYSSAPNRANALALNECAQKTRDYLSTKKGLFDPLSNRVNEAKRHLGVFTNAASRVQPPQARQLLIRFSMESNNLLSFVERPAIIWKDNIDITNNQFDAIIEWEKEYQTIINLLLDQLVYEAEFSTTLPVPRPGKQESEFAQTHGITEPPVAENLAGSTQTEADYQPEIVEATLPISPDLSDLADQPQRNPKATILLENSIPGLTEVESRMGTERNFTFKDRNGNIYGITRGRYNERENLNFVAKREFGHSAEVADWEEIKSNFGQNITGFLDGLGITSGVNERFIISRKNDLKFSGTKQYFVNRFDGEIPSNYILYDQIGNNVLALGAWNNLNSRIIVKYRIE